MSILDEINEATNATPNQASYQVNLPDFYGPMDLLLNLIEQEELEITEISLAHVTNQYLSYVTTLQELIPDHLTDFLVVASKLLLIKSQVLLPKPPLSIIDEEEDETDDLVQQLKDYKRFKQLAQDLQALESRGQRSFVRLATPPKIEPKLEFGQAKVTDLLTAVRRALTVTPEQPDVDTVVSRQEVTIGDQINMIRTRLDISHNLRFDELLAESRSRVEVIVTLLAVLELTKRRFIDVKQEINFGGITLIKQEGTALSEGEWSELESLTEIS